MAIWCRPDGLSKNEYQFKQYTGWSKKATYFVLLAKVVFYNFFPYFQVVYRASLGDFIDTKMDIIGRIITQLRIKFKDAYFA